MKLAIISSYSESCGNAAFTKVLHDTIESRLGVDVEVLELDLSLLQSTNRVVRKKAEKHIDTLRDRLMDFDCVNIQVEAGLYGTLPNDIIRRVKKLIDRNPNTSVTLHSPRLLGRSGQDIRGAIKDIVSLRVRAGLQKLRELGPGQIHLHINRSIIKYAIKNKCKLIVHTKRAKKQIKLLYDYSNVEVHPLKIVSDDFCVDPGFRDGLCRDLGLHESDVLIGMFGYISSYKGHMDAILAMAELPENFKLVIFGRQHPQTLKSNGEPDGYITKLLNTISAIDHKNKNRKKMKLKERILFMGELSDEDFLQAAGSIDVAWLPYYENGQDGSGVASICLDASKRVLCSTSFAFDELFKIINYNNVMRFDIGNFMEMATKTKIIVKRPLKDKSFIPYDLSTQAKLYAKF